MLPEAQGCLLQLRNHFNKGVIESTGKACCIPRTTQVLLVGVSLTHEGSVLSRHRSTPETMTWEGQVSLCGCSTPGYCVFPAVHSKECSTQGTFKTTPRSGCSIPLPLGESFLHQTQWTCHKRVGPPAFQSDLFKQIELCSAPFAARSKGRSLFSSSFPFSCSRLPQDHRLRREWVRSSATTCGPLYIWLP